MKSSQEPENPEPGSNREYKEKVKAIKIIVQL